MKYLLDLGQLPRLEDVVLQDLNDLGVATDICKKDSDLTVIRKSRSKEESLNACGSSVVFGNSLDSVPSVLIKGCGYVPRFLVDSIQVLEENINVEGLFRKSGAIHRLKELRARIEAGESVSDAQPLDIASLVKQFLRELPEPLLTGSLHSVFVGCVLSNGGFQTVKSEAVLLTCLLLPLPNLSTLRYVAQFLSRVAAASEVNRMDAANLSVCLAPNLLYMGGSRTNIADSSVLSAETAVIRVMIERAADIGMVSNSLIERTLMVGPCYSSLPSDLQNVSVNASISASTSKPVKKKKRSGSLQGLVSTFSASFSRWRNNKDKAGHDSSTISDASVMSYISFDKSSAFIDGENVDESSIHEVDNTDIEASIMPAVTPKLMLRKRKADDESVPFSTTKRKAILSNMPHRSLLGGTPFTPHFKKGMNHTPNIDFSLDSEGLVFTGATPKVPTPQQEANSHASSISSSRLNRKTSLGKSGCFSPKTSKVGLRHSFRGFLRRLSGGKDRQRQMSNANTSEVFDIEKISTSSADDHVLSVVSQTSSTKKGTSSLFSRRKKTPSLSNQLVTSLVPPEPEDFLMVTDDKKTSNSSSCMFVRGENKRLPVAESSQDKLMWLNMSLPSQRTRQRVYSEDGTPVGSTSLRRGRPNSIRSGLPSPLQNSNLLPACRHSIVATIDTSPILGCQETGLSLSCSQSKDLVISVNDGSETSESDDFTLPAVPRCTSKTSIDIASDVIMDESTHNQAFTESMLNDSLAATPLLTSCTNNESKPDSVDDSFQDLRAHTASAESVSDKHSLAMVSIDRQPIADLAPISNTPMLSMMDCHTPVEVTGPGSISSLDSAVEVGTPEQLAATLELPIKRTSSKQSIASHDSGVSMNAHDPLSATSVSLTLNASVKSPSEMFNSFQFTREGSQSIRIRSSLRKPTSKPVCPQPNLQVTAGLHHLLSKAGLPVEEAHLSPVSETQSAGVSVSSTCAKDLQGEANGTTVNELRELFERHSSPLRFTNSTTRTLRIISPNTKGELDTSGKPPASSKRLPVIPISTNLLRVSFENDCVSMKLPKAASVIAPGADPSMVMVQTPGSKDCPPRIKSTLLTPSMAQRLGKKVSATSAGTRSPGKPVKRLQVSSPAHRSPKQSISPGRISASNQVPSTISVPFNIDGADF